MDRELNIVAISDIHVGCPRLNPRALHQRFIKYLYPHITKGVDLLFICGDFFDTLLNLNAVASLESLEIIDELKRLCRENGCDLRVLRGTFTHDRNQPQHFIYGDDPNDNSVRLFDKVSLEYHEKTGLNILYIPDNVATNDIYKDIREILDAHEVERADILIHHGYFKHMLDPAIRDRQHGALDADLIQKYVKGCVLNGHVHQASIYQNVISVGSFDRMTHGDEKAKGFFKIRIDTAGAYHFNFIENKEASKFITYDLMTFGNMGSDAVAFFTKKWESAIATFIPGEEVHIRFKTEDQAIIEGCSQIAQEKWPTTVVDKLNVVKREQILENVNTGLEELPVITPANIRELLFPIVQKRTPNITQQDIDDVISCCEDKKEI